MNTITKDSTGPAVEDVQRRLLSLGYPLGPAGVNGVFSQITADAVSAFREDEGLPPGEEVDQSTWSALVDATFALGDRTLYLRMPFFHGHDVVELQQALGSLGFACGGADGIFGAHTERAVREFQVNAGIGSDGIVGASTFAAVMRLQHAWHGKGALATEDQSLGFARAAEVLENTEICIFGIDPIARAIASRVSNLAMATTPASKVVSADSLGAIPAKTTLMVQIATQPIENIEGTPQVLFDDGRAFSARVRTAIELCAPDAQRVVVMVPPPKGEVETITERDEQHIAITLLDALCLAFV